MPATMVDERAKASRGSAAGNYHISTKGRSVVPEEVLFGVQNNAYCGNIVVSF